MRPREARQNEPAPLSRETTAMWVALAFAAGTVLLAALSRSALAADGPAARTATGKAPTLDDYSILWRRNMFSSTRQPYRVRMPEPNRVYVPTPPRPTPTYDVRRGWVLRGMLVGDDHFTAMVENTSTGELRQLQPGQQMGSWRLRAIDLDGVDMVSDANETLRVPVGGMLAGTAETGSSSRSSYSSYRPGTSSSTSTAAAAEPNNPALESILERLRKKREQETGGRP